MSAVPLRSRLVALLVMLCVPLEGLAAAHLHPETIAAWLSYVSATETRIARELGSDRGFLAIDFLPDAVSAKRDVLNGSVAVARMQTNDAQGQRLGAPAALI